MSTVLVRSLRPAMAIWILLSMLSLGISIEPKASMKVSKRLRKSLEAQGYICIDLKRLESGYLTTTVTVDNTDLVLIVDTGAPDTHFDPTRTKALGFQWTRDNGALTAKAGGSTETCEVRQLILGKVTAGPLMVGSHDTTDLNLLLEAYGDSTIDGVLGGDVLSAHAAVLDFSGRRLFLHPTPKMSDTEKEYSILRLKTSPDRVVE